MSMLDAADLKRTKLDNYLYFIGTYLRGPLKPKIKIKHNFVIKNVCSEYFNPFKKYQFGSVNFDFGEKKYVLTSVTRWMDNFCNIWPFQ